MDMTTELFYLDLIWTDSRTSGEVVMRYIYFFSADNGGLSSEATAAIAIIGVIASLLTIAVSALTIVSILTKCFRKCQKKGM